MSDSIQLDLIGYVLNALEPDERHALDARIQTDPQLRDQVARIRSAMSVLDDPEACDPPAGLAARTCALVEREREAASNTTPLSRLTTHRLVREPLSLPARAWRAVDIAAALACCVALAALVFPLINASRASSRIAACANNLRDLGAALTSYSEHHNGMFPEVPEHGNLSAAGIYAPKLIDAGYLHNPRIVVCPGSPLADRASLHIPTLDELRAANADRLIELQRDMGGSYGYALGYRANGVYKPIRNLRRETFAIAADMPAEDPANGIDRQASPNHGWTGHNVLLEDGHVVYLRTCHLDGSPDNIFLNDDNQIAAGCNLNDAVVARSNARP
jgi:hypothetical protein